MQAEDLKAETTRQPLALPPAFVAEEPRKITEEEREFEAYRTLRNEWANAKHEGKRKARAAKVRCNLLCPRYIHKPRFNSAEGRGRGCQEEVNTCRLFLPLFTLWPFRTMSFALHVFKTGYARGYCFPCSMPRRL